MKTQIQKKHLQAAIALALMLTMAAPLTTITHARAGILESGWENSYGTDPLDGGKWLYAITGEGGKYIPGNIVEVSSSWANSGLYSLHCHQHPGDPASETLVYWKTAGSLLSRANLQFYAIINSYINNGGFNPIAIFRWTGTESYMFLCINGASRNLRLVYVEDTGPYKTVDSATTLDIGRKYCFELEHIIGDGTAEWHVYLDGSEVLDLAQTGKTQTHPFDQIDIGSCVGFIGGSQELDMNFDDVVIDDANYIGPAGVIPPSALTISITPTSASLNVGQSQTLTATPAGGTPPYKINWYQRVTAANTLIGAGSSIVLGPFTTDGIYRIYAIVTDASSATAQSSDAIITVSAAPPVTHTLTIVAATGGTTNPSAGQYIYTGGANVLVQATASANYTLTNWLLNGVSSGSSANPISVNMTADITLAPVFTPTTPTGTIFGNQNPPQNGFSAWGAGELVANRFSVNSNGQITSVFVWAISMGDVAQPARVAIYDGNQNLLGVSEEEYVQPVADGQWTEFPFPTPVIFNAGDIWLAYFSPQNPPFPLTTGVAGAIFDVVFGVGADAPATLDIYNYNHYQFPWLMSIYAVYTPNSL